MSKPCDRRSPGKEDGCNLKPFEAIQRVRPPPGRGAARQPEASLAREAATSLAKRRQRKLKPCVSLNTVHFTSWITVVKSILVVGCGVRGRSG